MLPLGAGQDVGRSCVLVSLNHKTVMFDCGMHMGYNDARRFPDFTKIVRGGDWGVGVCVRVCDVKEGEGWKEREREEEELQ